MVHDVQDMGREIEREREEMTRDVGREKRKGDGGQRREKGKKNHLYVTHCFILAANYPLRRLALVLIFPLLGSLTLFYTRGPPGFRAHSNSLKLHSNL